MKGGKNILRIATPFNMPQPRRDTKDQARRKPPEDGHEFRVGEPQDSTQAVQLRSVLAAASARLLARSVHA
jgi:hypothetical protein